MKKHIEKNKKPIIGILEWFRPGEYEQVKQAIKDLKVLNIKHLRTGISWADWYEDGTKEWYDWLFKTLDKHVEILPCFHYTPPLLGEENKTSSPPKNLKDYADFIDVMITEYGEYFDWVELWNEPNNQLDYDFTLDYSWNKFSEMIGMAAHWAKKRGKKTLLGGMSPIDPNWLKMMAERGVLKYIDAVGIHGFPEVFDQKWRGWKTEINDIKEVLKTFNLQKEIWISEVGFSTWNFDEVKQYKEFKKVLQTDVERIYWYSLKDLDPALSTTGGFHLDEREYHFGLKNNEGKKKLLYKLIEKNGLENIENHKYIAKQYQPIEEKYILITGGAGFVGTNLTAKFLDLGYKVMIYDNLYREGVKENLKWLKKEYQENLIIQIADIREKNILQNSVNNAIAVFHFASQVAVTTSITNPLGDFQINLSGTFNVLECIRKSPHQPPLLFTSTNKVYGNLENLEFKLNKTRYEAVNPEIKNKGISEKQALDFHSPYGCSKGAADQYILDYSKTYGLKTLVFRMSCIYGPHQFGNEDQGWVAHFLISILKEKEISIFGNGKQVRDILYVEDLVNAFLLALKNIDQLKGEVFNIGGGTENAVSLLEILNKIEKITAIKPEINFEDWRRGDQYYYVSNTNKFSKLTGWKPKYNVDEGLKALLNWLKKHRGFTSTAALKTKDKKVLI